ncbi:hypothetical protein [Pseudomonas fluorescens]|uniref:hypothetical protein n=1 Tax=Pseudomonas fluorescens TaxID=294 RepID=UPI000CA28F70|nr:hypothetical protein [Pseudomonas fluorescens]AUM69310.1 hypothetical protein C0J56_10630 [Pseudomonas fluorescens]
MSVKALWLIHRLPKQPKNPRQHKGEPKLPFNFVVACSFLLLRGGLLLFWQPWPFTAVLAIPIRDQEQTYFLSADLPFRLAIQPIRELPEGSFIILCPVAGCFWKHPEKHIFSKKIC